MFCLLEMPMQHQLALESLERVQQEKAQMEEAQREVENELRRESADLRINQAEMQKVLSAVAAHSVDIPSIVALCATYVDASMESPGEAALHVAPRAQKSGQIFNQASEPKSDGGELRRSLDDLVGATTSSHQAAQKSTACQQASALSLHTETHKYHERDSPDPASQQLDLAEANIAQERRNIKSEVQRETPATTTHSSAEWKAEHDPLSARGPPGSQRFRKEKSDACLPGQASLALASGACSPGLTPSVPLSMRSTHADQPEERGSSYRSWHEANRLPSTTLPTPRSPPKAALAPLVSPSKLMQALRMHAITPKADRHCRRQLSSRRDANVVNSDRRDANVVNSEAVSVKPLHRNPAESSPEQPEANANELATSLPQEDEKFERSTVETERLPQSNRSRAAAEQAWEDFVGAYGQPTKKPYASPFMNRRIERWETVRMSGKQRTSSLPDSDSQCDETELNHEEKCVLQGFHSSNLPRATEENTSLTRESTDSALQDVLHIEQAFQDGELDDLGNAEKTHSSKDETVDLLTLDSNNQLGMSATNFLRRLGTQLETRMRVSSNRKHHLC